jgi:hypothetical protein
MVAQEKRNGPGPGKALRQARVNANSVTSPDDAPGKNGGWGCRCDPIRGHSALDCAAVVGCSPHMTLSDEANGQERNQPKRPLLDGFAF